MTGWPQLQYHKRIMSTVQMAHQFSDRAYALITPCIRKGTADHIITTRMSICLQVLCPIWENIRSSLRKF